MNNYYQRLFMSLNHYVITTPAGAIVALRVAQSAEKALRYPSANPYCTATVWRKDEDPKPLQTCPNCGSINTVIWSRKDPSRVCNNCKQTYSLATRRDKYWPDDGLDPLQQAHALYTQGATFSQIAEAMGISSQWASKTVTRYNNQLRKQVREIQAAKDSLSKADFAHQQRRATLERIIPQLAEALKPYTPHQLTISTYRRAINKEIFKIIASDDDKSLDS